MYYKDAEESERRDVEKGSFLKKFRQKTVGAWRGSADSIAGKGGGYLEAKAASAPRISFLYYLYTIYLCILSDKWKYNIQLERGGRPQVGNFTLNYFNYAYIG